MKIELKNIGPIKSGKIALNDLTIFCGDNNAGKTYLSYSIFGLLNFLRTSSEINIDPLDIELLKKNRFISIELDKIIVDIPIFLKTIANQYTKILHKVFSVSSDVFDKSKISLSDILVDFDISRELKSVIGSKDKELIILHKPKDKAIVEITLAETNNDIPDRIINSFVKNAVSRLLMSEISYKPIAITSERTGISLFYKDLDLNRNQIITYLAKNKKINPFEMIDNMTSSYADPINYNIEFIRDFENLRKKKSVFCKNKKLIKLWVKILSGKIKYSNNEANLLIKEKNDIIEVPLHITSSSIKSLVSFDLYLRHMASKRDILIIDEPELNLHPTRQILFARLLGMLVNNGIKVILTTHSDYMLKEFNNLIMFSNQFADRNRLLSKYKYENEFCLPKDKVSSYYINPNGTIEELSNSKFGIDYLKFDETIINQNEISETIYYSLEDSND